MCAMGFMLKTMMKWFVLFFIPTFRFGSTFDVNIVLVFKFYCVNKIQQFNRRTQAMMIRNMSFNPDVPNGTPIIFCYDLVDHTSRLVDCLKG